MSEDQRLKIVLLLLGGAAVAWYVMGRISVDIFREGAALRRWRPVAFAMPLLLIALIAPILGGAEVAIRLILSCALLTATAGLALVLFSRPEPFVRVAGRRQWATLLPTALVVWVILLRGDASPAATGVLIVFAVIVAWAQRSMPGPLMPLNPLETGRSTTLTIVNVLLLAIIGAVGAWAATSGARQAQQLIPQLPLEGAIAVLLLSPVVALPPALAAIAEARKDRAALAIDGLFRFIQIALLVALPTAMLVSLALTQGSGHTIFAAWKLPEFAAFRFSPVLVRVDGLLLIVAAMIFLPVALGRFRAGRAEGGVLLGLYLVYLVLQVTSHPR